MMQFMRDGKDLVPREMRTSFNRGFMYIIRLNSWAFEGRRRSPHFAGQLRANGEYPAKCLPIGFGNKMRGRHVVLYIFDRIFVRDDL